MTTHVPTVSPPSQAARALQRRAHELIPGGAHTYSKGDDQYPSIAPPLIARGRGARIWDTDGNEYIEYGPGQRTVTLGHGYPDVVEAAYAAMRDGCNFNRPAALEVAAAEALLPLFAGAEMVKFTKDGSTANTAAVKLARAHTGRRVAGLCVDHPFFSYDDWAIGLTDVDAGIPPEALALTESFLYDDVESARGVFERHPGDVACLMLEPGRHIAPKPDYLVRLKGLCEEHGALLILDEMTTAFRWSLNGAQSLFGVVPDITTVGKGMANGFSLSALMGRADILRLGGLDHDRERVFLLSTTHGAESPALAAHMAVIRVFQERNVVEHLYRIGALLRERLIEVIERHGVGEQVELLGRDCAMLFTSRDQEGGPSQEFRTLLLQELIKRGVLAPSLMVCFSHGEREVEETVAAFDGALAIYRAALENGVEGYLEGPPSKVVYRRYN
jgi:glutamate-1-semialdehyde 2,1-aminomutase